MNQFNIQVSVKKYSFILFTFLLLSNAVYADHSHQHIKVMGIDVYMMVMPAEIIGGYPKDHPETLMHQSERRVEGSQFHIRLVYLKKRTAGV